MYRIGARPKSQGVRLEEADLRLDVVLPGGEELFLDDQERQQQEHEYAGPDGQADHLALQRFLVRLAAAALRPAPLRLRPRAFRLRLGLRRHLDGFDLRAVFPPATIG